MKTILTIGAGSFIGGIFRYLLSVLIQTKAQSTFPIGTLVVNVLGCLLIGIVFGIAERTNLSQEWKLFLATGILGGFTTFSAFSNETVNLFRTGQIGFAIAYITSSLLIGLFATYIGFLFVK